MFETPWSKSCELTSNMLFVVETFIWTWSDAYSWSIITIVKVICITWPLVTSVAARPCKSWMFKPLQCLFNPVGAKLIIYRNCPPVFVLFTCVCSLIYSVSSTHALHSIKRCVTDASIDKLHTHFNPLSPVPRAIVYNFLAISGNGGWSHASYTSEVWTAGYPAVGTRRVNK